MSGSDYQEIPDISKLLSEKVNWNHKCKRTTKTNGYLISNSAQKYDFQTYAFPPGTAKNKADV